MSSPIQVETLRASSSSWTLLGAVFLRRRIRRLLTAARLASGEEASLQGGYHMNLEISNASLNLTGDIVTANCSFNNTLHNESIDMAGTLECPDVLLGRCSY